MSLLTETGTGQGSKINNVTVRAWIVLFVVLTACLNATLITVVNLYASWKGVTFTPVQIEPVLANVVFAVVGWYFAKETKLGDRKEKNESNPSATDRNSGAASDRPGY